MAYNDVKDVAAKALTPKTYEYDLMHNIIDRVPKPTTKKTLSTSGELKIEIQLTRGDFHYFHYGCDGFRDHGWGCAYRTLQSMISWILHKQQRAAELNIPSLREIQETLVRIEDKPKQFIGSRDWIGALEVFYTVDTLYDVPCKILHVTQHEDLNIHIPELLQYFQKYGGFVMMGGDMDAASKGIAGVHCNGKESFLLVVVS